MTDKANSMTEKNLLTIIKFHRTESPFGLLKPHSKCKGKKIFTIYE